MQSGKGHDGFQRYKPQKIRVIFNGVDADYWGEDVESTLREELGIDRDSFVLLCASRFAHDKGIGF